MIGSTIRSANTNATTPPNEMPPDHRTAASGTLPTEQTKLRTATAGPSTTFSIVRSGWLALWMKRPPKKPLPRSPMKPASRNPAPISFHSIAQSLRKLCATSDHASIEVSRSRRGASRVAGACWCRICACSACSRACCSSRRETNSRRSRIATTISTRPPANSARVNCQPISTHSTIPSSNTRFVEANWKASAEAAEAPLANSDLAIAIAAYEHEDEAAPRPVASATGRTPAPPSARSIRCLGTHACTIAEIANPSTSAHHTSHAISKLFDSPSPILETTSCIACQATIGWGAWRYALLRSRRSTLRTIVAEALLIAEPAADDAPLIAAWIMADGELIMSDPLRTATGWRGIGVGLGHARAGETAGARRAAAPPRREARARVARAADVCAGAGDHRGHDLRAAARAAVHLLYHRDRLRDRRRGDGRARRADRRGRMVRSAAHAVWRTAAVLAGGRAGDRGDGVGDGVHAFAAAAGDRRISVLHRLLRRVRALPRAVSRSASRGGGGAGAERAGAVPRGGDRSGADRWRSAVRALAEASFPSVRAAGLRHDPGVRMGHPRVGRAARTRAARAPDRAADDRRDQGPAARASGDARVHVRQRAVGTVAGGAEDVRSPVPDGRPRHEHVRGGRCDRDRGRARADRGSDQRQARRQVR